MQLKLHRCRRSRRRYHQRSKHLVFLFHLPHCSPTAAATTTTTNAAATNNEVTAIGSLTHIDLFCDPPDGAVIKAGFPPVLAMLSWPLHGNTVVTSLR